jgi:hypothetical protein
MQETTPESAAPRQDRTLKLAGISYMLGDAAMMAAGHLRGQKNVVAGAAIWLAGGAAAARYGNPNADHQLRILAGRLEQHLAKHGITIPDDVRAQSSLLKERSLWKKMEDFLYAHPSEMLNASYALGAGMLMRKGISKDFWIGATILTGALAGLLIKEDPDARKKAEGGSWFDKALAFAREKPLRVSGSLYAVGNLFLAGKVAEDFSARKSLYQDKPVQPYLFSTLQLACYLLSNSLLSLSPRNQISEAGMGKEAIKGLEDMAARIIAAQPPHLQMVLIEDVSRFLATQKGITYTSAEITAALHQRLASAVATPASQGFVAREARRETMPPMLR